MALITINVTTDSSGDASYDFSGEGVLAQVRYIPDASAPLDTDASVAIVGVSSGLEVYSQTGIGTSAFTKAPTQGSASNSDGSDVLYAADGTTVPAAVYVGGENLRLTVADGGDAKIGKFLIWIV